MLEVRHCINVMHVETNDGLNARLNLIEINIRGKLTPIEMGKHTYLPLACYIMSKNEK